MSFLQVCFGASEKSKDGYVVVTALDEAAALLESRESTVAQAEAKIQQSLEALDKRRNILSQQQDELKVQLSNLEDHMEVLARKKHDILSLQETLKKSQDDIQERSSKVKAIEDTLDAKETLLRTQAIDLEQREQTIQLKDESLRASQATLTQKEEACQTREASLIEMEETATVRLAEIQKIVDKAGVAEDEHTNSEQKVAETINEDEGIVERDEAKPISERDRVQKMIDDELDDLIKEAEQDELEEELEPEAVEALRTAAPKLAYKKKYYDVMNDKFLYFPSVLRTLVDYSLIEEAEKHYFDEEDEFPLNYCAALRSVATMKLMEDDDDIDEAYMAKLALDVD